MSMFKIALSAVVLASGAAFAAPQPAGPASLEVASIPAEGYTAPGGTTTASLAPDGRVRLADAYPQNEGHVQMGG